MIGNVITSIGVGGTVEAGELNLLEGDVGIGTNTPLDKLHVANGRILLTAGQSICFGDVSKAKIEGHNNTKYLKFYSNGSVNMIIDDGDVGIGTTSPSEKLHIHAGGIYATPVAYIGNADEWLLKTGAWNNDDWDYGGIKVRVGSGGSPRLAFMDFVSAEVLSVESNKIGIGTGNTAPSAKLHVNGDIIRLQSSKTPASASASGNTGDICWDTGYLYVCTDTDTWKRAAISNW